MPDLLKIKKFLELQGCTQTIENLKWFKIAMPDLMKNKTFQNLQVVNKEILSDKFC